MKQASRGHKRYISDDAKMYSRNLKGPATALKQNSWGGQKICWLMVVSRGVVHVEVLPKGWTVDGEGLAAAVRLLPKVLRQMLGKDARLPRTLFTDRGTGMYSPMGHVVREYEEAVDKAGFKLFWGSNAKRQAADLGDVLLHETAVSWVRARLQRLKPDGCPWEETREQWVARLRKVVRSVNKECKVNDLCCAFPTRMQELKANGGDRLRT